MSTHRVEVVPVKLEPHPDADALSIVRVGLYIVCVRTDDWIGQDRGIYIEPDFVVPDTEQFAFLEGRRRIKARKLRGVMSQGLLIPAPEGAEIGQDFREELGIERYVPQMKAEIKQGQQQHGPPEPGPKYDLESWYKMGRKIFSPFPFGDIFVLTEKIHGTNARFTFQDGTMWAASKSFYRKQEEGTLYWDILKTNPWVEEYCRANPGFIIYGEIYGWVQSLRYGMDHETKFRAFDVFDPAYGFLSWWELWKSTAKGHRVSLLDNPFLVPIIADKSITSFEELSNFVDEHVDGDTKLTKEKQIREGIVIRPLMGAQSTRIGRGMIAKAVSPTYLSKK